MNNAANEIERLMREVADLSAALARCPHAIGCAAYAGDGTGDIWDDRCTCGRTAALESSPPAPDGRRMEIIEYLEAEADKFADGQHAYAIVRDWLRHTARLERRKRPP